MDSASYTTRSIDHLGLVAGFCQEVGLAEAIDGYLPAQSAHKYISYGQLVVAMILNGLGFTGRTLHMYPDYFSDKPIGRLLGPNITVEHINDDALGRCLDKLYDNDVSMLYQFLGEKVVQHLGLSCNTTNLDSTSFHVDGNYAVEDDFSGVHMTRGYSRDHRPDLNQVVLNLMTENQAGLPVYMQACSGNTNDSESFKRIVKSHITSLKAAQRSHYLVGDASLYDVRQRWLLVRSTQASKRKLATLKKRIIRSTEEPSKSFTKLCRQAFRCQADAQNALERWQAKQDYAKLNNISIAPIKKHQGRGRPKQDAEMAMHYQINGSLCCCIEKKKQAVALLGIFILSTNDCSGKLSMQSLLDHYKSQQAIEKGFRFLKSPDFLTASFFLKKPERIEALLMVMTCCLMIYTALEHKIRMKLREKAVYFADMKKTFTKTDCTLDILLLSRYS